MSLMESSVLVIKRNNEANQTCRLQLQGLVERLHQPSMMQHPTNCIRQVAQISRSAAEFGSRVGWGDHQGISGITTTEIKTL